jgi:hypothetical protein
MFSKLIFLIFSLELMFCEPRIYRGFVEEVIEVDGMAFPISVSSSLDAMVNNLFDLNNI